MSALEDEIFRRIRQMDGAQQRELLANIELVKEAEPDDWLERVRSLREELRSKYGEQHFGGVGDLVNEAREELTSKHECNIHTVEATLRETIK